MKLKIVCENMQIVVDGVVKYKTGITEPRSAGYMKIDLELENHAEYTFYDVKSVFVTAGKAATDD